MVLIDIEGTEFERGIGSAFVGIGFKKVEIRQSEINEFVESGGDWESYLELVLKARLISDNEIEVLQQ